MHRHVREQAHAAACGMNETRLSAWRSTSRSDPRRKSAASIPAWIDTMIRTARHRRCCASPHRVIDDHRLRHPRLRSFADTPIFTPSACEGTTTLFPVQYFDRTVSDTDRSALSRKRGWRSARCTASARRSAPRSRRRVVISRSSGWWSRRSRSRTSKASCDSPRTSQYVVHRARARSREKELKTLERDTQARGDRTPFPRITYHDATKTAPGEGIPKRGATTSAATRDGHLERFDRPSSSIATRREGVLLRALRGSGWRSTSTCSRPRVTARSSAAASATTISPRLEAAHRDAQAAAGSVQWYLDQRAYGGPPRGFRPGHRAVRVVDLRPRASCARRFPTGSAELVGGSREPERGGRQAQRSARGWGPAQLKKKTLLLFMKFRFHLPRLFEEHRRRRSHARHGAPIKHKDNAPRRKVGRRDRRRQHLRVHRRGRARSRSTPISRRPRSNARRLHRLVVAGCLVQCYPPAAARAPGVDAFVDLDEVPGWRRALSHMPPLRVDLPLVGAGQTIARGVRRFTDRRLSASTYLFDEPPSRS